MLKMIISMNKVKINAEKKYNLDSIQNTIDKLFLNLGLSLMEHSSRQWVYRDNGDDRDYGRFGRIVNTLKRQEWFMDNVEMWRFYDSDDSDAPDDFNEEDLLNHYRKQLSKCI